ncbi:MAG TPA: tetratricopeptide repeat protein, partial [Gemmataceae bacterium]|nr:tetratricopeptide repeat protein [Gemmataceae bacterium]
ARAAAFAKKDDHPRALADFTCRIRLKPPDPVAYLLRGTLRASHKAYGQAVADLTEAIKLDPKSPRGYVSRGMAYAEQKLYTKAIADFTEAIRLDPKDADIYFDRGRAYEKKKEYGKALADYNQAVQLAPDNAALFNHLAWALSTWPDHRYRDGPRAVSYGTRACELTLWKESAHLDTLAAAYAECRQFDDAVALMRKAIALGPPEHQAEFAERLKLFQQRKPYRQR